MHAQERILFEQILSYQFKKGDQKMNVRENLKSCLIPNLGLRGFFLIFFLFTLHPTRCIIVSALAGLPKV
jgi:hypothetical protein